MGLMVLVGPALLVGSALLLGFVLRLPSSLVLSLDEDDGEAGLWVELLFFIFSFHRSCQPCLYLL